MKTILLLLIFFFSLHLSAQTDFRFADSTAQWNEFMSYGNFPPSPGHWINMFIAATDTTINAEVYSTILGQEKNNPNLPKKFFVREDSTQKVFVRDYIYEGDKLVYDFSKVKGDTIWGLFDSYQFDSTIIYAGIVDSIEPVYLNNKWRKQMYIRYLAYNKEWKYFLPNQYYPQIVWIEGVGAINSSIFNPTYILQCYDCSVTSLLCYFENGKVLYHDDELTDTACVYKYEGVGVNELEEDNLVFISPNPATNSFISIELNPLSYPNTTFQLFDLTGRMILQKALEEKSTRVELEAISKGIYLYSVSFGKGQTYSGKLVVD